MRNITVTVSDQTYRQARVWAAQRDTSVSAVVTYLLHTLPGMSRAEAASALSRTDPRLLGKTSPPLLESR
jgi:ATP-dependent Clp protease adapter protein ClpS